MFFDDFLGVVVRVDPGFFRLRLLLLSVQLQRNPNSKLEQSYFVLETSLGQSYISGLCYEHMTIANDDFHECCLYCKCSGWKPTHLTSVFALRTSVSPPDADGIDTDAKY